ncbi:MAG TPA: hypothetical protein VKX24_07925 [Acidimicrobiia bacterium]|nr:hypothetical protein [Acidimicrobiia bacterium]HZQ79722.1 hypothetical protein [Acidimicrobiia bacterium]
MAATTTQSRSNGHRPGARKAVEHALDRHGLPISLPVVGRLRLPAPQHLVWYAGVAVLVALECVEWPIALVLATGKALADNRHSAVLQEFGEALEEVG